MRYPNVNRTESFWNEIERAENMFIDCIKGSTGTTVQIPVIKNYKSDIKESDLVDVLAQEIEYLQFVFMASNFVWSFRS